MNNRKACHNCRRRRLRCDRSVPVCHKCTKTGQTCLGYGKLYRWAEPAAPFNRQCQSRSAAVTRLRDSEFVLPDRRHGRQLCNRDQLDDRHRQTLKLALADPLLQDLSSSSRHYLSYFASRFCQDLVVYDSGTNPFRELIPMSQAYSYLQHIIIGVSAVHYYNAVRYATSEHSPVAQSALIDALHARQIAIRDLIALIQERRDSNRHAQTQADQDALLATVLFFVNFTLIDSGKDGWKDHLTVAGRLLSIHGPATMPFALPEKDEHQSQLKPPSPSSLDLASLLVPTISQKPLEVASEPLTACDYVTSDTVAYFIWNSALQSLVSSSPSLLPSFHTLDYAAQPLTWDVSKVMRILSRTEANSYHSCPAFLMGIVLRVARITQYLKTSNDLPPAATRMDAYLQLLQEAESFDIQAWAAGVSARMFSILGAVNEHELRSRCHIAATYRAAVCLYILLVAPGLPAEIRRRTRLGIGDPASFPSLPTTEDLAATIFQQLSFIPKTSPLFKYTLWPVFLTGVDAVTDTHRLWVVERMCAMRDLCPWGFLTSAMETLAEIWKLRDSAIKGDNKHEAGSPGEITEADEMDDDGSDWLARLRGLKIDCLIV
ncbi:fungal-specific transcription factor domain-containing protein [Xylaria bambusicola]|uniref:fungal-specific transcription factor domain-containing protein n=1 Tax=Xylaria bambusicola TaxID=326684 RepID=UPI002007672B|nr:fungal-specific transcription factor domain-containing protein [Xylaria bambusicola]KAI0514654.1 fungal-specific transcription factor domain-containing protein [Xylaria bambusicola]